MVGPDTLPGTQEAIEAARAIIEDRRKTEWKARQNNPFYQFERPEDFVDYPELMEFALSDAVLQIVSGYYGLVPQIKEIGIWLTPPQEHQFSSQLFHLDKPESQLVKLFLNIDPTEDDGGPLTFLPSNVSSKVREKTTYEAIYFRGDGRLKDETVFSICSQPTRSAGGRRGHRRICRYLELLPFRQPLRIRRTQDVDGRFHVAAQGARPPHAAVRSRSTSGG